MTRVPVPSGARTLAERLREEGPGPTARAVARRLDRITWTAASDFRDRQFDRARNVDTSGIQHWNTEAIAADASFAHATEYQGVPARRFTRLIDALPITRREWTFIDLGCGKGKALVLAAELGFGRVVGVELSPALTRIAEANAASMRASGAVADVVCQDATTFVFPPEPTVVFLFNPFDASIMEKVVQRLDESLERAPRPMYVVYLNALAADVLDRSRHLHRVPMSGEVLHPPRGHGLRARLAHERGGNEPASSVILSSGKSRAVRLCESTHMTPFVP